MFDDDKTIDFINKSKYRRYVIESLSTGPKFPSQIAKSSDLSSNYISIVIRSLKEKELVEIINPEVKKGRLYRLTDYGNSIFEKIEF